MNLHEYLALASAVIDARLERTDDARLDERNAVEMWDVIRACEPDLTWDDYCVRLDYYLDQRARAAMH